MSLRQNLGRRKNIATTMRKYSIFRTSSQNYKYEQRVVSERMVETKWEGARSGSRGKIEALRQRNVDIRGSEPHLSMELQLRIIAYRKNPMERKMLPYRFSKPGQALAEPISRRSRPADFTSLNMLTHVSRFSFHL